jgi:putative mycofactocin binding protein MftB
MSERPATGEPAPAGLDGRWRLHPRVALRPEPFGALAYHYGNRRLNFLRSPDLVTVVEQLGHHADVPTALDACGIDRRRWPSFSRALASLAASDFLQPAGTTEETVEETAGESERP